MIGNTSGQFLAKRSLAVALAIGLGAAVGACSPFAASVADHWPHWAGGMPADVPPRPGAPGYDEFIAHGQADQQAAKSGAVAAAPNGQAAPGAAAAMPATAARPAPIFSPAAAPAAAVEPVAPAGEEPDDTSAVRGGLY